MRSFVTILLFAGIFGLPQPGESSAPADDHDDSDMWMEPDELPPPQYSVVKSESRVVRQFSPTPQFQHQQHQPQHHQQPHGFRPTYSTISRVEHYEPQVVISSRSYDAQNPAPAEQNFFPSFFRTQPFTTLFRPPKSVTPPSQAASIVGRYSVGRSVNQNQFDQSILGSGDFSVVRGGTFYPEDERTFRVKGEDEFVASFLNGHGRPSAQASTQRKEPYYPENPFENFKDFADINAGNDPAFSHFVVVYANKNSTKPHPKPKSPKNIFEQLQLLDQEKEEEKKDQEVSEKDSENEKQLMKLSKYKSKLAKTKKVVKKYKKKLGPKYDAPSASSSSSISSPDYTDPLLALS